MFRPCDRYEYEKSLHEQRQGLHQSSPKSLEKWASWKSLITDTSYWICKYDMVWQNLPCFQLSFWEFQWQLSGTTFGSWSNAIWVISALSAVKDVGRQLHKEVLENVEVWIRALASNLQASSSPCCGCRQHLATPSTAGSCRGGASKERWTLESRVCRMVSHTHSSK